MSRPSIRFTEYEAPDGYLPYPATKLVVSQYLERNGETGLWAWIAVGAFYDADENCVWSSEWCAGQLGHPDNSDGDSETGDVEQIESSESESSGEDGYQSDQEQDAHPLPRKIPFQYHHACES